MGDGWALMQHILDNPADNNTRLMFADWLDEQNQNDASAWARFIRLQIERSLTKNRTEQQVLMRREERLVRASNWVKWTFLRGIDGLNALVYYSEVSQDPTGLSSEDSMICKFSRGFLTSVHVRLNDWLRWGPQIVRRAPIEQVTLADKEPSRIIHMAPYQSPKFMWYRGLEANLLGRDELPYCIIDRMAGTIYSHLEDSNKAVSRALIEYAKTTI
jgi:uncharacterized protein (TIGR02996 family)